MRATSTKRYVILLHRRINEFCSYTTKKFESSCHGAPFLQCVVSLATWEQEHSQSLYSNKVPSFPPAHIEWSRIWDLRARRLNEIIHVWHVGKRRSIRRKSPSDDRGFWRKFDDYRFRMRVKLRHMFCTTLAWAVEWVANTDMRIFDSATY